MMKSIIVMDTTFSDLVYDQETMEEIKRLTTLVAKPMTSEELLEDLSILADVEVMFSSWGGPNMDQEILDAAPMLKIIFYGAGSIKRIITDEFWNRGLRITTANTINAVPVAEYTLAATILGLKNSLAMNQYYKEHNVVPKREQRPIRGGYKAKVGLISLGAIAKKVLKFFALFDYDVYVYDPFVSEETASKLGVSLTDLDTVFSTCDVVSLHTPLLDSTRGMIKKEHILQMKEHSTFINTSRGAIIDESGMIEALLERKDITAYLDVVYPEPPAKDSPLFTMKNVYLTPHIAGSEGRETARMGNAMLKEFIRYSEGKELEHEVSKEQFEVMA